MIQPSINIVYDLKIRYIFGPVTSPSSLSQVRAHLLDRMLTAHLEPGDRIALPQVARKLGISVTPVREALTQLSYSGLVVYRERRGFFVDELSAPEAHRLYHTVVALETEAVRLAEAGEIDLAALAGLNSQFAVATTAVERFRLDKAFHEGLAIYFRGSTVEQLLEDLRLRIFLYERAYLEHAANVLASVALHNVVLDALRAEDTDAALSALRQNWLNIEPVLAAAGVPPQ